MKNMQLTRRICFNPCFIGTYSFTQLKKCLTEYNQHVLILVLLELILLLFIISYGLLYFLQVLILVLLELILLHQGLFIDRREYYEVLILVLLELILLPSISFFSASFLFSFNPCFIGTYSFTIF